MKFKKDDLVRVREVEGHTHLDGVWVIVGRYEHGSEPDRWSIRRNVPLRHGFNSVLLTYNFPGDGLQKISESLS